jgi:hypothetical protein
MVTDWVCAALAAAVVCASAGLISGRLALCTTAARATIVDNFFFRDDIASSFKKSAP